MVIRTQTSPVDAAPAIDHSPVETPSAAAPRDRARSDAIDQADGSPAALAAVEAVMREASVTDGELGRLAGEQLGIRGKRLRAQLTLDAFSAVTAGAPSPSAQRAAAAVELIHQASLIHDDLTDQDGERRGQAAAWKTYGADTALLLGDHFLAAAFDAVAAIDNPAPVVRELASAVREAAAGQASEADEVAIATIDDPVSDYESRARAKSGALMALPVAAGSLVAGADATRVKAAQRAWNALGAAYQIGDDLAELAGRKAGRSRQSDLAQRRLSAPVVHWLTQANADDAAAMRTFLEGSPDASADIPAWRQRLLNSAAPEACRAHQARLIADARSAAVSLPEGGRGLLERTIEWIRDVETSPAVP